MNRVRAPGTRNLEPRAGCILGALMAMFSIRHCNLRIPVWLPSDIGEKP